MGGHMDARVLKDKTTVFEVSGMVAVPFYWQYGETAQVLSDDAAHGVMGYRFCGAITKIKHELPTEFFNHQLMDVRPDSEDDVRSFIESWGMPLSPARFDRSCLAGYSEAARRATKSAIRATDAMPGNEAGMCGYDFSISIAEARDTITLLQSIITDLLAFIKGDGAMPAFAAVNAASRYPLALVDMDEGNRMCGNLTAAICNQIIETIEDPAPWRECAYTKCNRIFKRKQSPAKRPNSDSVYCCKTHEETQKKANNRAAKKSQNDHGI